MIYPAEHAGKSDQIPEFAQILKRQNIRTSSCPFAKVDKNSNIGH
jgi:hypothetical protein